MLPGVKQTMFKVSTATSASLPDIGPKLDPISRTFQEFALNAGPTQCLAVQSRAKKLATTSYQMIIRS